MKYRRIALLVFILALPLALVSVSSYAEDDKSDPSAEIKEKPKNSATITIGMPEEEVLKLLGEPDSRKRMKASDGGFVEFWNYSRIAGQYTKYQVTGAEMVEVWSPSVGRWIEVPEEIEELVQTTIIQRVELIMHKGRVLTFEAALDRDIDVIGQ